VDAVDVEEINARGDVSLNDLCADGLDGFRQRGAIERSSEAIMVHARLLAGADQREADAIAATTAESCSPRSTGRINGTGPRIFS
jgi:hypothetical protein